MKPNWLTATREEAVASNVGKFTPDSTFKIGLEIEQNNKIFILTWSTLNLIWNEQYWKFYLRELFF